MNSMNKNTKKIFCLVAASVLVSACDTDFSTTVGDTSSYSAGDADFSKYVAIGDSLTAGYADGALYLSGQENSFPAILAQQFATVGGGAFTQPLVDDNFGGLLIASNPLPGFDNRLVLDGITQSPEPIAGTPTTDITSPLTGEFSNMGVPGAKSYHLGAPGYGSLAGVTAVPATANPYFARFASSATTTMITDAAAQLPSFYTLWIGNNDVLSYATTCGIGVDQTGNPNPPPYGSNDITDPTAFAGIYGQLVGAFAAANANAKGVLINIPDVSTIPFFTTVPFNAVPLDQATADTLNAAYATYNGGVQAALGATIISSEEAAQRTITFAAGQNAVVIEDEDLVDVNTASGGAIPIPNYRQATASDLILLPVSAYLGTEDENSAGATPPAGKPWGLGTPLTDADVLIPSEILAIDTARLAFNAAIAATAAGNANLEFYDAAADLQTLKDTGINYGTGSINSTYATGGGFSLDGVHPTARGYAVIANGIIDTINTGFNANIPNVDPGLYTTIFIK